MRTKMMQGVANQQKTLADAASKAVTAPSRAPELSVVIPLGPRHEDLGEICRTLRRVFTSRSYEVIFVDDATEIRTRQELRGVIRDCPEARVIRLQRRMGEATALAIGAQSARGEILVTIDPYLHVALDQLPKLLSPLADGMDVVCAWRFPRQETGLSRVATTAFNTIARWLSGVPVHDLNSRTRAVRRAVFENLPLYGDLHRFLPIFAARRGYRWCEVQVPQQPGKQELGAQGLRAIVSRGLDLLTLAFLTRFVKRPLHFFGVIGAGSTAVGLGLSLYLTYTKLVLGLAIGHRPLLLLAVLLIVMGVQIASIGLLGELLIFTHARELRDYVIQQEAGSGPAAEETSR